MMTMMLLLLLGNNFLILLQAHWPQSPTVLRTSSPNCVNSMTCTSPCTISGLDPGTEYQFTVIPNNNCGSPTGCTGNRATAQTACECEHQFVCACVCVYEPTSLYHKSYFIAISWVVHPLGHVPNSWIGIVCQYDIAVWLCVKYGYVEAKSINFDASKHL